MAHLQALAFGLSFSALEDEPWIEAVGGWRNRGSQRSVSVLLKTSRGLKHEIKPAIQRGKLGFSALEDEPWIEALVCAGCTRKHRLFQCS